MSTSYLVPLSGVSETFSIKLNNVAYKLTVQWRNATMGGWFLDIADSAANPIVQGIPLVTGADLLEQYAYLGLGGSLYVQTAQDADAVPTFDNLGTDSNLYFVVG